MSFFIVSVDLESAEILVNREGIRRLLRRLSRKSRDGGGVCGAYRRDWGHRVFHVERLWLEGIVGESGVVVVSRRKRVSTLWNGLEFDGSLSLRFLLFSLFAFHLALFLIKSLSGSLNEPLDSLLLAHGDHEWRIAGGCVRICLEGGVLAQIGRWKCHQIAEVTSDDSLLCDLGGLLASALWRRHCEGDGWFGCLLGTACCLHGRAEGRGFDRVAVRRE